MKTNAVLSYALSTIKEIKLVLSPKLHYSQKKMVIELVANIFYNYIDVIEKRILPDSKINESLDDINRISGDISTILGDKDYLLTWIYIGDTIILWQKKAVELEEYEIAQNLKRLFNNDKHDQE
jgi:hypothetical protein